jgi:hypothetical protein
MYSKMNNSMRITVYILLLSLATSCIIDNKEPDITLINIKYIKGIIETNKPIECGTLNKILSSGVKDTIISDKAILIIIKHQISNTFNLTLDTPVSVCDIRMQCNIKLTNGDTVVLCIGEFNCLIKEDTRIMKNDTIVYLMRKYSGYYNYFPQDELDFFEELKFFGKPKDYKNLTINKNRDPNIPPLPPGSSRFRE